MQWLNKATPNNGNPIESLTEVFIEAEIDQHATYIITESCKVNNKDSGKDMKLSNTTSCTSVFAQMK